MKLAGHPATEAKHMNNWLNRLERKYGRYGIPNLTNILVAGQILVLAIELFVDRTIPFWLGLSRSLLLQGQVWRVISFIFIPFSGGSILSVVLGIYFTWFVGTALEREWGRFPLHGVSAVRRAGHGAGLPAYRRDRKHLLPVPLAAAGLCHALPGGAAAALLRHPHPGEVFRLFCGGVVGIQLSGRFHARQAGLPAVHAQCMALLCPHGLPLPPRMGAPGAVEEKK